MKIIVDAFGGDNAPLEILKGAAMAVAEYGVEILLTGDETTIQKVAVENGVSLDRMEIVHAPQVMSMDAEPTEILKSYQDSSMAVGLKLLSEGKGDAFVSAGSTGAFVVGASLIVKRIKGIKRAALAPVIPTVEGRYMLIDCGANAECRPEMLVQFGVMGAAYMNKIMNVDNPRVALINNGAEEHKGTPLQQEAYQQLKESSLHFVGNIEARKLPQGGCDVAVCDGFTGNIVLKLTEGLSKALIGQIKEILMKNTMTKLAALTLKSGLADFKKKMDYKEYGGAALLGISKSTIKAHGSSDAKAFKNAIGQAVRFTSQDVIGSIEGYLAEMKAKKQGAENA
ncbi:MAG: phosphate acyltransferase PlsX [Oscillospiraceae bacterium]|nr:phosphate acyltransferase PlsX [Oscillospiraceae bacterium]